MPLAEELRSNGYSIRSRARRDPPFAPFLLRERRRQLVKGPVEFTAGLVRMLEVPRAGSNLLALRLGLRSAGAGPVHAAQRRGLGRRHELGHQQHAPGAAQLGQRLRLGQRRPGRRAVRSPAWAADHGVCRKEPVERSSTCCSRATSPRRRKALILAAGDGAPDGLRKRSTDPCLTARSFSSPDPTMED